MTPNVPNEYSPSNYERPSVTVDVVIFSLIGDQLHVLLIQRKYPPFRGMWAIPGGFVKMDETLEAAAARELQEETGVTGVHIEQLYTFGDPGRDPRGRVITIVYFALVPANALAHRPGDDAAAADWFSMMKLPLLAFDHAIILDYALQQLHDKLERFSARFRLLPDEFTLTELQHAYEIVLGKPLDEQDFRRRLLSAEILLETGRKKKEAGGRSAKLYRYRENVVT